MTDYEDRAMHAQRHRDALQDERDEEIEAARQRKAQWRRQRWRRVPVDHAARVRALAVKAALL